MRPNLISSAGAIALASLMALFFIPEAIARDSIAPTSSWTDANAPRPLPESGWLQLMDTAPCYGPTCLRAHWIAFLSSLNLSELEAPNGGRAYRWLWFGTDPNGPLGMHAPHRGFVEVLIDPAGKAVLRSIWSKKAIELDAKEVAPFEAALAQTQFANLPSQTRGSCLDECEDQVMEAVIGGQYHFIAEDGGIRETGVRDAGVILEQLARTTTGE